MEVLCETVAGHANMRSMKLVGEIEMCPDKPEDFWSYLPKSLEKLEITINQFHFIEPLYNDMRKSPESRLYLPNLKHFVCHLNCADERFDWVYQRDSEMLVEWGVVYDMSDSEEDEEELLRKYQRESDGAEMYFMDCLSG